MIDRLRSCHQPVAPRAQGRTLSVLVLDESDRPVGTAGIELISRAQRLSAVTDSAGIARIVSLVGDSVTILVRSIGFFSTRIEARVEELGENVTIYLNRQPYGIALVPCVLRVMLDGIVLPALSDIDKVVPQDVHGVEVFFGAASIPPSLGGMRSDNWCGLIAIWTRSGGG